MADKRVYQAELMVLVVTIIWGLGFPITKIAVNNGFMPNTIMVGRFLTASIILTVVFRKHLKYIDKNTIVFGVITGLFLFLGFYFQTVGNVYTTATKNGFITQLNIVFVPYLYYLFFKKKVDLYNIISVVIAVVGLFILSYTKGAGFTEFNKGDFFTLICAIMVAFNLVTNSFFQKKYDLSPIPFTIVTMYLAAFLSLIAMITFDTVPVVTLSNVWPLLFLGVFNTALGFLVQSYALKISKPTKISLIVSLESLFSAIGAVLILNDVLTLNVVIGGLLIITGILITEAKPFKKYKKSPL
ncbi:hypothetical protein CI105_01635 [Candidatus Izimaplasma bacterium ZiA1]|uniref:DMT family transporter n=1 Tax=Candidatus Izimoplasma sp. ZiA1 TaxID=2024899 RepID=UPI000BAA7262|nr:hypothetical protein CI105_01635 [Candidatus Izimaplasma bacterium ZiA1]